ncbi:MAG: GHKL domain-containing protein [Lachnospiraceae bacterium]|nr:GHKL domain-containing protein [Lachnospiraceae bacterium]
MENLVYLFSCFLSCMIIAGLMFQFMGDRYEKVFVNPWVYRIAAAVVVVIVTLVNLKRSVWWNMGANFLVFGIASFIFYEDKSGRRYWRVVESECFLIITGVLFEGIGVFGIDLLMEKLSLMPEDVVISSSIEVVFSKLVLIFFYYVLLRRIWKKDYRQSRTQVFLYLVMFIYSMFNTLMFATAATRKADYFLLCTNLGCVIFANLYLIYALKVEDEKNSMEFQIAMMKQQESMQFEHYERQREKYGRSIEILHDVSKHIHSIEELYQAGVTDKAMEYTKQIGSILKPLVPEEYSDNPMLNILLADRKQAAESQGIKFEVKVESTGLGFIEPVDVTTLFGNLLENAMQAVLKCSGERYIKVHIRNYNEMISIRIENSVEKEVMIKNGKPVSTDGKGTGIGCLNVERCVKKYGGSVLYKNGNGKFYSDAILNR